jgi:hypothetical protein
VNVQRSPSTIGVMTTTPNDQEWLRLAEEAFTSDQEDEAMQEKSEQQAQWRYRRPLA